MPELCQPAPARRHRAAFAAAFALAAAMIILPSSAPPILARQGPAAAKAAKPALLVLNKAEATLAIVDPSTMQVVARVPVGDGPHEVATSADGRTAYVTNYGGQKPGNSISVIDVVAQKEVRRVDLGPLLRPHGIFERGGKLYFTAELSRAVARYDPASDKVDLILGTGQVVTHMLVMHPTRPVLYTTNILSDTATVMELDKPEQPGPGPRLTHVKVGPKPEALDVTPDGRELWVGHNDDGGISIIDTETNKVKETIKVGGMPIRIKFTPDGRHALVSSPPTGELTILEAATRKEVRRLKIEGTPIGVLISPDGSRAYVAAAQTGRVVAVNLSDLTVGQSVETGKGPDGLGWAAP